MKTKGKPVQISIFLEEVRVHRVREIMIHAGKC